MQQTMNLLALVLVVVGALNWGLVGLAQFDLVAALFGGPDAALSRIVYGLVGLAGVGLILFLATGRDVTANSVAVSAAR